MNKPFHLWLRDKIAQQGLTQRGFSKLVDIDESNVSNYILGKRIPDTRTLIRIILVLHNDGPKNQLVELLWEALTSIENIEVYDAIE